MFVSFLNVTVLNGNIFGGLLKFKIFCGMPAIPDFLGETVDAGSTPTY